MIRTIRLAALPLTLALLATPMAAQMPTEAPGKMDVSRVTAGTYTADPGHSLIAWSVNHLGFNDYYGLFGDVTGTLTLDPAHTEAAKVTATIPVSKVVTVNQALNAHLLRPAGESGKADFFGANPADATFVSTKVTPGADRTSATIDGNLTLNGVTRPVSLRAHFTGAGIGMMNKAPTIGFQAETTIKRTDFGVSYGVPLVSDAVDLRITIAFEKK